ncbi:MalM family protein [Cobetia sp. 10Alg 146]|uniref:MalM family protein n=1 Tax=Cobetia sp. 10Alg 146 TaxID=3040019 RepID=UPI002448D1E2|nr:MalM family protein [Cobetia sp. 10Alg 146]MDH2292393.1 MalM family protein [Cobetia sp. 10Alg 146]
MSRDMRTLDTSLAESFSRMKLGVSIRNLSTALTGAVLIGAVLSGCATGGQGYLLGDQPTAVAVSRADAQWLSTTSACCSNLMQLPVQAVSSQETRTLEFTRDTPVFDFSTGKSPFQALMLPRGQGPLTLRLESDVIRSEQGLLSVFVPQVLVLDEQGAVHRRIAAQEMVYQPARGLSPDRLSGSITVTPEVDGQRVVIATTAAALDTTTEILHPARAQARARNLAEPQVENAKARHALTGHVRVRISRLSDSQGLLMPLMSSGTGHSHQQEVVEHAQTPDWGEERNVGVHNVVGGSGTGENGVDLDATSRSKVVDSTADFDFKRMIRAALTAGDISLALELAERAEQAGEQGTRQWLADKLRTR